MTQYLEFSYKKAVQALNYFASKEKGGKLDKLKAIKLIYLADRFHLRKYGRPITNDRYWAMPLGPVGSSVKDIAEISGFLADDEAEYVSEFITKEGSHQVKSKKDVDASVFSASDIDALHVIQATYGDLSTHKLVEEVHKFPEWKKFEDSLNGKIASREAMDYYDFFKDREDGKEDVFTLSKEIIESSLNSFKEQNELSHFIYS